MVDDAPLIADSAGITDRGHRRSANEDAYLNQPERGLWAVADGMGGHPGGEVASTATVQVLLDMALDDDFGAAQAQLRDGLMSANRHLYRRGRDQYDEPMGTTAVALLARGHQGVCLWAGDSRAYLYRQGELRPLTRDHTMAESLVAQGSLSPEQACHHPAGDMLTRGVGIEPEVELDATTITLAPGDTILLCSDGLYKEVDPAEMAPHLASSPQAAIGSLLQLALDRGGQDNITIVVVRFRRPA